MQYISNSGMNHLLAYGGKDGIYYTRINDTVYVVAKIKDDKVIGKKQCGSMADVEKWTSRFK